MRNIYFDVVFNDQLSASMIECVIINIFPKRHPNGENISYERERERERETQRHRETERDRERDITRERFLINN